MNAIKLLTYCLALTVLMGCIKHESASSQIVPKETFSGRLLVMTPSKRFQVEIDWQASENHGLLRLTHGLSGRVMNVSWKDKRLFWRDLSVSSLWQPMALNKLVKMGIILPPWEMAKVFTGVMPKTMKAKGKLEWQGLWAGKALRVRWSESQNKVELLDVKHGRRALVYFDE